MKLYKYYSLNPYSKRVITDQEIFLSSFISLNDPFEIAIKYTFDCDHQKKHQYFLKNVPTYSMFPPQNQKSYIEDFERNYSNSNGYLLQMLRDSFGDAGVFCLSESPSDILMWSHYSGKHRGFCVEFDTDLDPLFRDLFQVQYFPTFKEIVYYDGLTVKDALDKKFDVWGYEREWRVVKPQFGTYKVNPKCITAIYLGPLHRFIPTAKNEYGDKDSYFGVIELASKHLPNIKFRNLRISRDAYSLIEY